jgi:hypothetical protein
MSKNGLLRLSRVLLRNQIITTENQQLLVVAVNCISALADGRGTNWSQVMDYDVHANTQGADATGKPARKIREFVVDYLSQTAPNTHHTLALFHACTFCLCILCGHSSEGYSGVAANALQSKVFEHVSEISVLLKCVDVALKSVIATSK